VAEVAANSPFRHDLLGCMEQVKGKTIALIRHPAARKRARPDIVVAPFGVGKGCSTARVVVDRRVLQAEGAQALYVERGCRSGAKALPRRAGEGPRCGR
jgi:hypothetical protein